MFSQNCPICKSEVEPNEDFPYCLCDNCAGNVTDRHGKPVVYLFEKSPKGFRGKYKQEPLKDYIYDICFINGEEMKVYVSNRKVVIQPVNILKFASRPEAADGTEKAEAVPNDPEKKRSVKNQIVIEKIIIPAGIITLFSIFPLVAGLLMLLLDGTGKWYFNATYISASVASLFLSWKMIIARLKRFGNASYFKQHCYSFLAIGILSLISYVLLLAFDISF